MTNMVGGGLFCHSGYTHKIIEKREREQDAMEFEETNI